MTGCDIGCNIWFFPKEIEGETKIEKMKCGMDIHAECYRMIQHSKKLRDWSRVKIWKLSEDLWIYRSSQCEGRSHCRGSWPPCLPVPKCIPVGYKVLVQWELEHTSREYTWPSGNAIGMLSPSMILPLIRQTIVEFARWLYGTSVASFPRPCGGDPPDSPSHTGQSTFLVAWSKHAGSLRATSPA